MQLQNVDGPHDLGNRGPPLVDEGDGSILQAAYGFATVRGKKIYVQCNGAFDGTAVPEGCAQSLALK